MMKLVRRYEIVRFDVDTLVEESVGLEFGSAAQAEAKADELAGKYEGYYYSFKVKNYFVPTKIN